MRPATFNAILGRLRAVSTKCPDDARIIVALLPDDIVGPVWPVDPLDDGAVRRRVDHVERLLTGNATPPQTTAADLDHIP